MFAACGRHIGAVYAVTSQQEGSGFKPASLQVCMFSLCLHGFSLGSHWVLWLPPSGQTHAGASAALNGRLSP